jgi:electron transfer flavoprotein beta subunit
MMKIFVCVKQVVYLYSRMGVGSAGKIDPDGFVYIMNPYDESALEEALRVKQGVDQVEVTLISLGAKRVEGALRYGLAMGADQAIHICDEKLENIDPWMKSKILAKMLEARGFDLILCGKKAIDDNDGLVGGFIAEILGLPYVSSVTEISVEPVGKRVRMLQVLGGGDRQQIECDLPALFTVERGRLKPRYPTLIGRLAASRKEILKVNSGLGDDFGVESEQKVVKLSISRPKPKRIFAPDSNLPAEERIKSIMSGGLVEKKSQSTKGSPQELAEQFINFLEENRVIKIRKGLAGRKE